MSKPPAKLLIIDDTASLRNALSTRLEKEGYTIFTAANGKKGLELAFKHKPDLILLDIAMPVMSGIDVAKELRKDEWGKNVTIIVLSNLLNSTYIANAVELGATAYVIKSDVHLQEIVDMVKDKITM